MSAPCFVFGSIRTLGWAPPPPVWEGAGWPQTPGSRSSKRGSPPPFYTSSLPVKWLGGTSGHCFLEAGALAGDFRSSVHLIRSLYWVFWSLSPQSTISKLWLPITIASSLPVKSSCLSVTVPRLHSHFQWASTSKVPHRSFHGDGSAVSIHINCFPIISFSLFTMRFLLTILSLPGSHLSCSSGHSAFSIRT